MDDSCRRAGAVPFKWEICPGTPKHTRSASAAAAVAVSPAPALAKVVTKRQLALPPCMTSPCASPSPYYHSPRVASSAACRSASVSPCHRRYGAGAQYRPRPTAFLDLAPRAAAPDLYGYGYGHGTAAPPAREADDETAPPPAYGCFPLPLLRRKGSSKKRSGYASGSGSGSSSSDSFRSDGELAGRLRRSASSSSSFSFPRGNRRLAESSRQQHQEAEAATGSWLF
uniref:Uncharacterized protein n=2 Tax=Oryza brachyantha TaxID=4533 RepID=J3N6H8_ORYBR